MTRVNIGIQDIQGYTGYTITLGYTRVCMAYSVHFSMLVQ